MATTICTYPYQARDGNDVAFYTLAAIPEPSAGFVLAAIALAGLARRKR